MLDELLQQAEQAKNAGDDEKAVQIYKKAVELCGNDPSRAPQLAYCLQELAQIFYQYGQFADAIPLFKKLIDLGAQILGPEHRDTISAGVNLARIYEANGEFDLADKQYKFATDKAEKAFGIGDPMAQEIRQEYFDAVDARQLVQEDKLRHGLTLERASQTNPNNSVVNQPALDPEAAKSKGDNVKTGKKYSSLKQSTKIKKLRYVAESIEEDSSNILKAQGLRRHGRDIFYGLSVILCIGAIFVAFSKLYVPNEMPGGKLIHSGLIGKIFKSVDDFAGIQFVDNKYIVLLNDVHSRKIPYVLMSGTLSDLKELALSMLARKQVWYQLNQDELTGEDGNIYYSGNAPEFSVLQKMQNLANFASRYFKANGCYPDRADRLKDEPGLAYINPFDSKPDLPTVRRLSVNFARDSLFPGLKPDAPAKDCYLYLRRGGSWKDDQAGKPGKISSLSLFNNQRCADGYKVTEFYIHGYDRHGHLISAGKPETHIAFGFQNGRPLNDDVRERAVETERASVHPPEKIYVSPGEVLDVRFWRFVFDALLIGSMILGIIVWLSLDSKKRKEQPTAPLYMTEYIFIALVLLYVYIMIIRLIP